MSERNSEHFPVFLCIISHFYEKVQINVYITFLSGKNKTPKETITITVYLRNFLSCTVLFIKIIRAVREGKGDQIPIDFMCESSVTSSIQFFFSYFFFGVRLENRQQNADPFFFL